MISILIVLFMAILLTIAFIQDLIDLYVRNLRNYGDYTTTIIRYLMAGLWCLFYYLTHK